MNLLERVVDGFILTVGITPPTPERRKLATVFIACGLVGTVVAVLALFAYLISRLVEHAGR